MHLQVAQQVLDHVRECRRQYLQAKAAPYILGQLPGRVSEGRFVAVFLDDRELKEPRRKVNGRGPPTPV